MISIMSKMELFAKVYAKNAGVTIKVGANFATDGETITIPPLGDQHDAWKRFETEVCTYHETGHIKTGDIKAFRSITPRTKQVVFNVVRDVAVEHTMETEYPGMKAKWVEFLTTYINKTFNARINGNSMSAFEKIVDLLYLRGREKQLGVDLGVKVPKAIQEYFDKRLARFVDDVATKLTIKNSQDLTEEIFKVLKEDAQTQPQQQPQQKQKGKPQKGQGSGDDSEQDDGEQGQDDEQDGEQGSDDSNGEGEKKKSNPKEADDEGDSGDSTDASDGDGDDDQDSSGEDGEGDSSGDSDGDEVREQSSDGTGPEDDEASSDEADDKGSASDSSSGNSSSSLSDAAKQVADDVKEETEDNLTNATTIIDDVKEEVNRYTQSNKIYRERDDLKDTHVVPYQRTGWESEVARYEAEGRKLVGVSSGKLKRLFISEKAPVWHKNLRSGRLDVRKLWRVKTGSRDVCKRKMQGVLEDACVYEVIDNSSSMKGSSGAVAQSILTSVSSDLDKLRVPFGVVGFTFDGDYSTTASEGVRTTPCVLYHYKRFHEPYRCVRPRFVWPQHTSGTAEFPAIKYASRELALRRETKKVLFILTDGETSTGNGNLDDAMRVAMKEHLERISRAGIKVVGIGIYSRDLEAYCPDFLYVRDLSKFAEEFYDKLTKILL